MADYLVGIDSECFKMYSKTQTSKSIFSYYKTVSAVQLFCGQNWLKIFLIDEGGVVMKMVNEIQFTIYFMPGVCGTRFYKNVLIMKDKKAT